MKRICAICIICALLMGLLPMAATATAATGMTSINLGDYIELGTYNGEDILWRCVAFEKATRQADGSILIDSTQTSQTYQAVGEAEGNVGYLPLMIADQIITIKAFDANGTTSGSHGRDSSNRNSSGSNYWGDSNLRDWLNSEAASVTWTDGNGPTSDKTHNHGTGYDTEAGFLNSANFNAQALKAITRNVKQKSLLHSKDQSVKDTASGTTVHTYSPSIGSVVQNYSSAMYKYETDSVFCLDVQQLYNMHQNTQSDTNAAGSAYYIGTPTAGAQKQYSSAQAGENWPYWLRSPCYLDSFFVRCVGTGGSVSDYGACGGGYGVRPAFFLDAESVSFVCGNGARDTPYTLEHTLIHHEKVPATLTADGTMEYWECSVCGKKFSDETATNEITNTTIPAGIQLGDYIELGTYNGEDILWRCVAFEKATRQADGSILIDSTQTSQTYQAVGGNENDTGFFPLMIADQIITFKAFDASGLVAIGSDGTTNSHGRGGEKAGWGSQYWGDSTLRYWLNGEYDANNAVWPCGNAPTKANCSNYNGYDQEAGFLNSANFNAQAKAAIAEVTQKTHLTQWHESEAVSDSNATTRLAYSSGYDAYTPGEWAGDYYSQIFYELNEDKMFLLDVKQLENMYANTKNGKNSAGGPYYVGTATAGAAEQSTTGGYSVTANATKATWLRSPRHDGPQYIYVVYGDNNLNEQTASMGQHGVRPAFFLDAEYLFNNNDIWLGGDGAKENPYYITEGTVDDPCLISNLETLEAFRNKVNGGATYEGKHFKLTADIDLGGSESKQWTPIGNNTTKFAGVFDGQGHTVSGLYIVGDGDYHGLFGCSAGTIRNVTAAGQVGLWSRIGGVCGSNSGLIENCVNQCAVSLENPYAFYCGGICGENTGTIRNCVNQGAVTSNGGQSGGNYIGCGGICGYNVGGRVENCYNTGTVTGANNSEASGGVCGVSTSGGTVANCFNTGAVTGQGRLAGVCADASGGTVTNCYYDSEKCAANDPNSGVAGKPTAEFASGAVAKLLQGDDPASPWGQAIGNDGLPVLLPTLPEEEQGQRGAIYTVTFMADAAEYAKAYANPGGTVELPEAPASGTLVFVGWSQTNSPDGEAFTADTAVNSDMTVYAVGQEGYGQTEGSKIVTATYGTAATQDLSAYMAYETGTEVAGKFDYAITAGAVDGISVEGDTLTVADNVNAGIYDLTITATEKTPQISLLAVDYGTQPVDLNVTVKVNKAANRITGLTCADIAHGETPAPTVTAAFGTPSYTFSSDQLTYGPWSAENHIGAWYVKATVAGTDNYDGAESEAVSFQVTAEGEPTPNASISYRAETLTGLTAGANYTVTPAEGTAQEVTADETGAVPIQPYWLGKTLSIVKIARSEDYSNSAPQSLDVKARPDPPTGALTLTKTADGITVTNANAAWEYSVDGVNWNDGVFAGLAVGQAYAVQFRLKATDSEFCSQGRAQSVATVSADGSTALKPGESVTVDGATITNNGNTITAEQGGTTTTITPPSSGGVQVDGDGTVTAPADSTIQTGDDNPQITLPGGGTVNLQGEITLDPGTSVVVDGREVALGPAMGGTVDPDGTVKSGELTVGDTTVTVPMGGGTANVDVTGEITVPAGATITTPEGSATITEGTGAVKPDGTITFPDGGKVTVTDSEGKTTEVTVNPGDTVDPAAPPHVHSWAEAWDTSDTHHWHNCTVEDCDVTDDSGKEGYGEHDWDEGVVTTEASYDADGVMTYTCTACGREKTEPIPMLSHHFSEDWTADGDYHWHVCTDEDCTVISAKAAHDWGEGEITTPATCTEKGVATYTCATCSATKTGEIPATGEHTYDGYQNDEAEHWQVCSVCNAETAKTAHVYDNDQDAACNICGYERTVTPPAPTVYTVTFDTQCDIEVATQSVTEGERATKPTDPTRSGYTFGGWYKEAGCTTPWNFETDVVTESITLYAKWTAQPSGGGSSGGSTSRKPSVSVGSSGEGGKVTAGRDGTVTITPDEGYEIVKITVNGEEVKIPEDGKLTGLKRTDKVVVTFGEIPAPVPVSQRFTDVKAGEWYVDAVQYVVDHGLFNGTSDTTFSPNGTMTRGMLATVLYRLENEPEITARELFSDVADDQYYTQGIAWAADKNIVSGYGNGSFGPNDPITREQLAVMLWRYAGAPTGTGSLDSFTDSAKADTWAADALKWAVEQGIITGKGGGILDPQGQATRAEVAAMIQRFLALK